MSLVVHFHTFETPQAFLLILRYRSSSGIRYLCWTGDAHNN